MDVKMKELCIMKLLNHILQPTMYDDIREVAREYLLEENVDKYLVNFKFCILASISENIQIGFYSVIYIGSLFKLRTTRSTLTFVKL